MSTYAKLIYERFNEDNPNWKEISEIATYDAVNKDIAVKAYADGTKRRYSIEHADLTIDDNFYFEQKITPKVPTAAPKNTFPAVFVGDLNKDEPTNRKNFIGFCHITNIPTVGDITHRLWFYVWYSDGVQKTDGLNNLYLDEGTQYLCKCWYDGANRIAKIKVFSGADFDVLVVEKEVTLSSSKSFTVNDFGVGNLDTNDYPTAGSEIDYDDAYLYKKIDEIEENVYQGITHIMGGAKVVADNSDGKLIGAYEVFSPMCIFDEDDNKIFDGRLMDIKYKDEIGDIAILYLHDFLSELMERPIIKSFTTKTASYIVEDLIDTYGRNITHVNVQATTRSMTRVFKGMRPLEIIKVLADEEGFNFWIDLNNDFHFQEQAYESSGKSLIEGTDAIIDTEFPKAGREVWNRVTVYGKIVDNTQKLGMAEDRASQDYYKITREQFIQDRSLETDDDCEARATGELKAWVVDVGKVWVADYEDAEIGKTIYLKIDSKNIDGNYVVLEKEFFMPAMKTYLLTAGYVKGMEGAIADMIRELREKSAGSIDEESDIVSEIQRFYESFEVKDTLKIWTIDIGESKILGHPTNGILGITSPQIVLGRSGTTETLVVDQ